MEIRFYLNWKKALWNQNEEKAWHAYKNLMTWHENISSTVLNLFNKA